MINPRQFVLNFICLSLVALLGLAYAWNVFVAVTHIII